MSFSEFQASASGQVIAALLADPAILMRMKQLSRDGRPAVEALDQALAEDMSLDDTERQFVGRWVRDALAPGWKPIKQKRLAAGRIFSSGSVYGPLGSGAEPLAEVPTGLMPVAERVARAQAIVRATTRSAYGVDEYLRDKRADDKNERH